MKLTHWFPASIKPVRKGWYEVGESSPLHISSNGKLHGRPFRYWSGTKWLTASPDRAWSFPSMFGTHPKHQWRGSTLPLQARGARL